jgi:hypothetical protein
MPAADPPKNLAEVVRDNEEVPPVRRLVGNQLGQCRHHSCQAVVGTQPTGFTDFVAVDRPVTVWINAQRQGPLPRAHQ